MKNFVLFGGNSEFCKTFIDLSKHKGYKVWGVSRKKIDNLSIDNQLLVSDYFKESTRILDFLKKIDQPYIFFFNGFLAENRPSYSPTIKEIKNDVYPNKYFNWSKYKISCFVISIIMKT